MIPLKELIRVLIWQEDGQAVMEYGLVLVIVSIIVIGAMSFIGDKVYGVFDSFLQLIE